MILKIDLIKVNGRKRSLNDDKVTELASSIKEIGLMNPITVSENYTLIAGLHRMHAVKQLGYTEIEVNVMKLSDLDRELAEIDENLIRADLHFIDRGDHLRRRKEIYEEKYPETKQGQYGQKGSKVILKDENVIIPFSTVKTFVEDTAQKIGVSESTIEKEIQISNNLSPEIKEQIKQTDISKTTALKIARMKPEKQKQIVNKIISGKDESIAIKEVQKDERKEIQKEKQDELLKSVDINSKNWIVTDNQSVIPCDIILTDPPYGITENDFEPNDLEKFTQDWLRQWNTCGADFFVIFWSQKYLWDGKIWFDTCLSNYQFQQLLIWHYPNNKKPQSRQMFKQTYEPIFFYRKKGCIKEVKSSSLVWTDGLNEFDCHVTATPQSNYNNENCKQHPTQKPISVMRWLVNVLSNPNELICDPFSGSGTTGIAALQLKRRFHGIEINKDYLELSKERLNVYGNK